jgi:hypothetical protein
LKVGGLERYQGGVPKQRDSDQCGYQVSA